jgi:hypothetical protein
MCNFFFLFKKEAKSCCMFGKTIFHYKILEKLGEARLLPTIKIVKGNFDE